MNVKTYAKTLDEKSKEQIKNLAHSEAFSETKIRIMPDAHTGAGCVIGTTIKLNGKVSPYLVGVDIGCGVLSAPIPETIKTIDFAKLDGAIRKNIPNGKQIHTESHQEFGQISEGLKASGVDLDRAGKSLGTLGGGNHFIEVGKNKGGELRIFIHSGSRKFGLDIAEHYQNIAKVGALARLKDQYPETDPNISYRDAVHAHGEICGFPALAGEDYTNYINDMLIANRYAKRNRQLMVQAIFAAMGWESPLDGEIIDTIHNYIGADEILRKGAVSAYKGEKLLIPLNMRDGILLCEGKGNEDWNFSAPHGAGRLYSRTKAKAELSLAEFQRQMKGIYSTCVHKHTLDEAPMAYKDATEIVEAVDDTVSIVDRFFPVFNFKAN